MSESPLIISNLNDFIFCPASMYFHLLEEGENLLVQDACQLNGSHAHRNSDSAAYSTKVSVLQGIGIYCEKYNLVGKIDTFDSQSGVLTERKKKIKKVYDGYVFQLYAQYFALVEMGYTINTMKLYSMDDNKIYEIPKPEDNFQMLYKFEKTIYDINHFSISKFKQDNEFKCKNCIYEPLCSYSYLKEEK